MLLWNYFLCVNSGEQKIQLSSSGKLHHTDYAKHNQGTSTHFRMGGFTVSFCLPPTSVYVHNNNTFVLLPSQPTGQQPYVKMLSLPRKTIVDQMILYIVNNLHRWDTNTDICSWINRCQRSFGCRCRPKPFLKQELWNRENCAYGTSPRRDWLPPRLHCFESRKKRQWQGHIIWSLGKWSISVSLITWIKF